jgi:hypothetical protein
LTIERDDSVPPGKSFGVVPKIDSMDHSICTAEINNPRIATSGHPAAQFYVVGFTVCVMHNYAVKIDRDVADAEANATKISAHCGDMYRVVIYKVIDFTFSEDLPSSLSRYRRNAYQTKAKDYR